VAVAAANDIGQSAQTSALEATPAAPSSPSPPDPPTNVQLTPGDQSILVTWDAPANVGPPATFTGYNLYIYDSVDHPDGLFASTTNTSYNFTGLVNGRVYEVTVFTSNSGPDGASDPTARLSATPAAPPPPVAASLTLNAVAVGDRIDIDWEYADPNNENVALHEIVVEISGPDGYTDTYRTGLNLSNNTFSDLSVGSYTLNASAYDDNENLLESAAPVTVLLEPPSGPVLTLSAVPGNNTFTPSWTFDDGVENSTATYYYKVDAGGSVSLNHVSGEEFPTPLAAGTQGYTVTVYSDDALTIEVKSESSTVEVANGVLTLTGSLLISTANNTGGFKCLIDNDNSKESYLTLTSKYSVAFTDSDGQSVSVVNGVPLTDRGFGTDYENVEFSKAGPMTATFTAYSLDSLEVGNATSTARNISGLNAKVDTSVSKKVTVEWAFYDDDGVYVASPFSNIFIELLVDGNAQAYTFTNSAQTGSVTFEQAPAGAPGMRASLSQSLIEDDYGKPFVVSVQALGANGVPLASLGGSGDPSFSGTVPDDVAEISAQARGGIRCAIVAWDYSDVGNTKPIVDSYSVEFNNQDSNGASPLFEDITPEKSGNVFNDSVLVPGTYDVEVSVNYAGEPSLLAPSQAITVYEVPQDFGVVSAMSVLGGGGNTLGFRKNIRASAASHTVDVSWERALDLDQATLGGSYDLSEDITVTLTPDNNNQAPISLSVPNDSTSLRFSNVPDGSYEVRVSQNLVGLSFQGLNFTSKLIQTIMPNRIVLGTTPQPQTGGGVALNFLRPHDASVSQNVDITLIGEQITTPQNVVQTLNIKVLASDLNAAFEVAPAAGWELDDLTAPADGVQTYPEVTFKASNLVTAATALQSNVITKFQELNATGQLDDKGIAYETLQDYIADMNNSDFPDDILLNSIPVEAVRSVTNTTLTIIAGDRVEALFEDETDLEVASGAPPDNSYALQLFAQAVGAGKVSNTSDNDRSVKFNFVEGDSISLFVNYSLSKTRTYLLDSNETAPSFKIGNITLDVEGDDKNNVETSNTITKKVEFKFYAVAPAVTP
jgi:hypothetical protein